MGRIKQKATGISAMAAEKLWDLSQPMDIPLLDATVAASNGTGSNEEKTAADHILRGLQNNPDMWLQVVHILSNAQHLNTKFFALEILEGVIKHRWNKVRVDQRNDMMNNISKVIEKESKCLSSDETSFQNESLYVKKLNITLVQILKHEWPTRWQSFIPNLVETAGKKGTNCENCMAILKLFSEEVFDFSRGGLTKQKFKKLKQSLKSQLQLIHELCIDMLSTSQRAELIRVTLGTIEALLHLFRVPAYRNLTLEFLTKVAALTIGELYNTQIVKMYITFMVQLQTILPPTYNFVEAYSNGTGDEQAFIQNLALFFTSFYKCHIRVLESTHENINALLMGLEYLMNISYVDVPEVFMVCLTYWNYFVFELFKANHKANPATTNIPLVGGLGEGVGSELMQRHQLYAVPMSKLRFLLIRRMSKTDKNMKHYEKFEQFKISETLLYMANHTEKQDWEWKMPKLLEKFPMNVKKIELIHTESSVGNLKEICDRLRNLGVFTEFFNSCFGQFTHFCNVDATTSLVALRAILSRQVIGPTMTDNEVWFRIGNQFVRFSLKEYVLITGLRSNKSTSLKPSSSSTTSSLESDLRTYFNFKSLNKSELLMFFKTHSLPPHVALKMAKILVLYYFLAPMNSVVEEWVLDLAQDDEAWEKYDWATYTYNKLLNAIHGISVNLKKKRSYYHFHGFSIALLIWAYEAIPKLGDKCGKRDTKLTDQIPRLKRWELPKRGNVTLDCVSKILNEEVSDLSRTLTPTLDESRQDYWRDIVDPIEKAHIFDEDLLQVISEMDALSNKNPESPLLPSPEASRKTQSKLVNEKNPFEERLEKNAEKVVFSEESCGEECVNMDLRIIELERKVEEAIKMKEVRDNKKAEFEAMFKEERILTTKYLKEIKDLVEKNQVTKVDELVDYLKRQAVETTQVSDAPVRSGLPVSAAGLKKTDPTGPSPASGRATKLKSVSARGSRGPARPWTTGQSAEKTPGQILKSAPRAKY